MIFVTVGAQMPFDRLVRAVDEWAGQHSGTDVFAQIGPSRYRPAHLRHERFLSPSRFRTVFQDASLVVAHAGMGSIITAMEYGKPILVMPRRGDLAETRNDHQLATARQFAYLGIVEMALEAQEVMDQLDRLSETRSTAPVAGIRCRLLNDGCQFKGTEACRSQVRGEPCPSFLAGLRAFINGQPVEAFMNDVRQPLRVGILPSRHAMAAPVRSLR